MDKKKRNGYYISMKLQEAMKVVAEVERVTQSNQIELALLPYLKDRYGELLEEHGITL